MASRLKFTCSGIEHILDMKYTAPSSNGYTLTRSIYEIRDFNLLLRSVFLNEAKLNFTFDDIRLSPKLTTKETTKFTEKSFFLNNIKY